MSNAQHNELNRIAGEQLKAIEAGNQAEINRLENELQRLIGGAA